MAFEKKQKDSKLKQFPNSEIVGILDTDWCAYSIASVGDEAYIEATHTKSGKVKEFKNVTAFRGVGKTIGGWLGDVNAEREKEDKKPFTLEDFTTEPKQRRKKEYETKTITKKEFKTEEYADFVEVEEVKGSKTDIKVRRQLTDDEALVRIYYSAKSTILRALEDLGTHKYESYLGKSGKFRENTSTLMKYKGNRDNTLRPLVMGEVVEYLQNSFDSELVYGIENDDKVTMRAYGDPNAVIVGEDKDFYGQPVRFFNANKPDEGIIDGDCFGKLWREDTKKKKVRGYGRLFLYWQILAGDDSDNYKASCMSDKKYGDVAAYKALFECEDDKEALENVIEVFKELYPEPKVVESWRGNKMLIDWLYVAREQFKMAAMLRFEGDSRTLDTEFDLYGVEYEY
jgi:hypothetical protein